MEPSIADLVKSSSIVYTFPPNLKVQQRSIVHDLADDSKSVCIAKQHGVIGTHTNYRTLLAELVEASMPKIPDDPHVAAPRVITATVSGRGRGRGRGRPPEGQK